jgi:hypothetical protein
MGLSVRSSARVEYAQAAFIFWLGLSEQTGLPSHQTLASRSAGLGLGATPKSSKPKPKQARWRGRKPVLQVDKVTLLNKLIS